MKLCTVFLILSIVAQAACVHDYPTVREEYLLSKIVLTGKIEHKRKTLDSADGYFADGDTYTVIPKRAYKGEVKSRLELFSENSSGRFPMQVGEEYLLFVYQDHGRLSIDNCGNSDLVSRRKKAVAEVSRLSEKH